jgi:TPR repeat protein
MSLAVLLVLLLTAVASPAAVRVYAKVDAETTIYSGDEFVYSVVVEGAARPSKIDISPLAPFHPRSAGSGTSMQTVNDRTTVSYSENYAITAGKAGTMHLPGVTVVVDGQTYTTNPVDVTVSPPGTTDRLSLELQVSEKQCYVGQPLVMTVKWTVTVRVQQGVFDVPVFKSDDFYIEDVTESAGGLAREQTAIHGVPVTATEERQLIRGVEGAIISFRKILIPKRSGPIQLEPITVSANMLVGGGRTGDFFDPYRARFQRVSVQSNAVALDVRPLPETGKPPQFYGLVGRYTISASAAPAKVSVGDPITLTIRIGGNPFFKPIQWPALEQVPELAAHFKIPAEKASPVLEGGSKVFTQTIRANSDKVTQVPAIPLAYFDSDQGKYVVAKTEPIRLEVAPTKVLTNVDVQGTASTPVNREVEAIRKGLSANYYGPEVLVNQSFSVLSVITRPVYAAIWAIPLMGLVVSSAVRLAGRRDPESLARRRRRRAGGAALSQLKKITSAEPQQRRELLLSALKTYIGDRFDKVAASLTAADCGRAILEVTGNADTAREYQELIDACETSRYASVSAPIGADQVQAAIELIQVVEKKNQESRIKNQKSNVPLRLLPLAFFLFTFSAAPALPREQLQTLLHEANTAFQAANAANNPEGAKPLYDRAILLYEKIIDQGGIQNAKLYCNLANAYLLKEDLGRAILNYRRAARLDSSDLNIQKNLAFARSRRVDRVETSTQKRVLQTLFFWHYDFSLRTKSLLACLFLAALCAASTRIIWWGRGSASVAVAVLSGVLWVCLVTSLLVETTREAKTRSGVITVAEVVARQGDGPNYPPSFKDALHAGMEFELIEHRPGWLHIQLSDGADAWVPDDTAGIV